MPSGNALLGFATVAFVLIVTPGPSVLFVVGRALAHGRRAALASVFGNTAGVFVQAVAVAFGVGAVVASSVVVFTVLKLFGAAYLVHLGARAIRERSALSRAVTEAVSVPAVRLRVRQGFVVGATNPKGFVLFSAVLPQFVEPSAGPVTLQMLLFGCVAVSIAVVTDTAWATLAGSVRRWLTRSRRSSEALSTAGGTMMIALGIQLAVTGRRD